MISGILCSLNYLSTRVCTPFLLGKMVCDESAVCGVGVDAVRDGVGEGNGSCVVVGDEQLDDGVFHLPAWRGIHSSF